MGAGQRWCYEPHPADAGNRNELAALGSKNRGLMNRTKERGVALILALILLLVLSVMGVSLMFLSQTETWSSFNYRLMSQARDGAEAGVNAAANFLMFSYTPPGGAALNTYTLTASPVTFGGNPAILSANSSVSSNYPDSSAQTSFKTAGQGN